MGLTCLYFGIKDEDVGAAAADEEGGADGWDGADGADGADDHPLR